MKILVAEDDRTNWNCAACSCPKADLKRFRHGIAPSALQAAATHNPIVRS